jgi:hypothetical protein
MNRTDNRKPAPRIVGWIGVALSIAVIVMCLIILAGCGDPCADHGGTVNVNKGIFLCADGTAV